METASHKGVGNQPVAEEFARAEARSCLNASFKNSVSHSRLLCLPRGFGWHDDLPRLALVSDCNMIREFHLCPGNTEYRRSPYRLQIVTPEAQG